METRNPALGISYCVVSSVLFVLNGVVLKVLTRHNEYKTNTYRIIKNMCVACMFQLVSYFAGGVMNLSNTVFHYYVDRVFGVLIQSSWFLYLALSLTLAIDRLVIFTLPKTFTFKDKITNCLLAVSWLFWLSTAIIICLPGFGCTFSANNNLLSWTYTSGDGALKMADIEAYFDLIVLIIILLIYLVVCRFVVKMRSSLSAQSKAFTVEVRMFLIAVISFTYEIVVALYSFWLPPFSDDYRVMQIFMNVAWMVYCGFFTIGTLIINQSLRRKVFELIGAKKRSATVATLAATVAQRKL